MELKRWDTGEVIFEMECATFRELVEGDTKEGISFYRAYMRNANMIGADMSGANMRGADMSGADMRGADMSGADMRDVNMSYADMRGADMRDVNMSYADMRGAIGNMIELKTLTLEKYVVTFNDSHMAIGCQQYTIEGWFEFTDDRISQMDYGALEWWKKWKDFIFTAIEMTKDIK